MTWTCFHLFAGAGGGALGCQRAGFESIGAVDFDAKACADLEYLTGEKATCADVSKLQPADIRAIAGNRRPDMFFTSSPCVGFSGCLPQVRSTEDYYLEKNDLAVRGVWLAVESWPEPPPLIVFENVPRITTRGRYLLDQIIALLHRYGYLVDTRTHDCGELGGLAQHRRRFLLVARHAATIPAFLMVPAQRRVKGVGEVLGSLPTPEMRKRSKSMHRLPTLSDLNWLRLALIPAGLDWKALPAEVGLPDNPSRHDGKLGVTDWNDPSKTVIGSARPCNSSCSVADPRLPPRKNRLNGGCGVNAWGDGAHAVVANAGVKHAWASVADPRIKYKPRAGSYGVVGDEQPSPTIRGHHSITQAPASIADPRVGWDHEAHGGRPHSYGVQDWREPSPTVRGSQRIQNTRGSVADPRLPVPTHEIVEVSGRPVLVGGPIDIDDAKSSGYRVIRAIDGSWHRPMTDLELAVIQGFPSEVDGKLLQLAGSSAQRRKHIGNAVPPPTAEAIARECMATLEAASDGWSLVPGGDIWVEERREW